MTRRETKEVALPITQFLHLALPPDAVAFHVPNEGRRTRHEQSEFLSCGGKAGIPDRWILWRGRAYCWEEKFENAPLSASQKKMFPRIEATGHPVPIVRSVEDAERVLQEWGFLLRASVAPGSPASAPRKCSAAVRRPRSALSASG